MRLAAFPLLVALSAGCTPIAARSVRSDSGDLPAVGSDGVDGGDGADGLDGGADGGGDGGDDGVEVLPGGAGLPQVQPPGGAFVDEIRVSLVDPGGAGVVAACLADPGDSCLPVETEGSILVDRSSILHARVQLPQAEGELVAYSFVELEAEVADVDSDLPFLVIWTDAAGDALWENTPAGITLFDRSGARASILDAPADSGRGRLRIRGSSSSSLDKKGFDLELWEPEGEGDRPVSLLGMPPDADWVLHAPSYFDDALMRNALVYAVSNDVGRYAPRTRMVELWLATRGRALAAGDYLGVYTLTEEIERGRNRVDVAALGPEDINEPEITGGYLFKRDRSGAGDAEIWAGDGDGAFYFTTPLVMVDPESSDLEAVQLDWLTAEIDAMGRALSRGDRTDPGSGRTVDEILDVDSFIDHHILNAYFKNPDSFRLSGYFSKDRQAPIVAGPVWDFDRTAGSIDSRALAANYWDATNFTTDTTPLFSYGWYGGLFADASFRARYWARWTELLDGPLAIDNILAHVDAFDAEMAESAQRNHDRWRGYDYDTEVAHLRSWLIQRDAWIRDCINTHSDPRTCAG